MINSHAQATEVLTGLNSPHGIAIKGNDLYISQRFMSSFEIMKFDVTDVTPVLEDVGHHNSGGITDMIFNGNDLFIANFAFRAIDTLDITDTDPIAARMIESGFNPRFLTSNNDYIFVSHPSGLRVTKIDLSVNSPTLELVIGGLNSPPYGIALSSNDLYIVQRGEHKISKIDITDINPIPIDVITGINDPYVLVLDGDYLYVGDFDEKNIYRLDITEINPTLELVVDLCCAPTGLVMHENYLFISQGYAGKISKIDIVNLSVAEVELNTAITLYPNPVHNVLYINSPNLLVESVIVYSLQGAVIKKATLVDEIDVSNLATGLYFIQLSSDGKNVTRKFIKR